MTASIILLSIFLTLIFCFLLSVLMVKNFKELLTKAIDISCYVNTYHYAKNEEERVKIGQEKFYQSLFGEKQSQRKKDKTDYIFWIFYTQYLEKPLSIIPLEINCYNNKCLMEGEVLDTKKYVNQIQDIRLVTTGDYASDEEFHKKIDECENITIIN